MVLQKNSVLLCAKGTSVIRSYRTVLLRTAAEKMGSKALMGCLSLVYMRLAVIFLFGLDPGGTHL